MTAPRLGPGAVVILAGPDAPYVVGTLETSGPDAVLYLRTEDGQDWLASSAATVLVPRRVDAQAREVYVETGSDLAGLAAARVGLEHVEHHGQPLRFVGSSFVGDTIEHRFACTDPACPVRFAWSVTS